MINTDNATRISKFEIILPQRYFIRNQGEDASPRDYVSYCDYKYLWEDDIHIKSRSMSILYLDGVSELESREIKECIGRVGMIPNWQQV